MNDPDNEIILCTTCMRPLNKLKNTEYCKCSFEINEKQLREMRNETYRNIPHSYKGEYRDTIINRVNIDNNKLNR